MLLFNQLQFLDFNSSSPPRRDQSTINTPVAAQKRFNPFMKDHMGKNQNNAIEATKYPDNTSPNSKNSLSPTQYHPLMDLGQDKLPYDELDDDTVVLMPSSQMEPNLVNFIDLSHEVTQTPVEAEAAEKDDHHNNNSNTTQHDEEAVESTDKATENLSITNNNTTCIKNNNHVSDTKKSEEDEDVEKTSNDGEFFVP